LGSAKLEFLCAFCADLSHVELKQENVRALVSIRGTITVADRIGGSSGPDGMPRADIPHWPSLNSYLRVFHVKTSA